MYCPYIKKGLTIRHDGRMIPCCHYNGDLGLNFKQTSIEDYFSSVKLDELESQLKNKQWPSACGLCQYAEKNSQTSMRLNAIAQPELFENYYLDLNIGTECNSDCAMCLPLDSSKIVSRIKQHGYPEELNYKLDFSKDEWSVYNDCWNNINDNIKNASVIKLIGGEPFLNKNIWKWLDSDLVKQNKQNITLQITTNASILPQNKIELLKGWKSLIINVSADATGKQFEWIRNGLSWKDIYSNTEILNSIDNSIVSIQSVVSIYSIVGIVDLLNWINDKDYLFLMITMTKPKHLVVDHAPISVLEKILEDLSLIKMKRKQNQIQLLSLKKYLKKCIIENKNDPDLLKKITDYFNNHRNGLMDTTTLKVK